MDYNLIKHFPSFAKNRYDLIICQDHWEGMAGYYTKKKFRTPYFVIIHRRINDMQRVKGISRILVYFALRYQRKVLLSANKVLTLIKSVSLTVEKFYLKYYLKTISDFPEINLKEFVPFSERKNTIALVSYWNEVKVPELYLNVFKKIKDFKFIMVGNRISEAYWKEYTEKPAKDHLLSRVTLILELSDREKNNAIGSSKFFLKFGKRENGPGYGSLDALRFGLTLIVNSEPGIVDDIKSYKVGFIVDDPKDTDRILRFINEYNNESYNELQAGIRQFINNHSWEKQCKLLMKGLK